MNSVCKKVILLMFITTTLSGCFYYYDVNDDANIKVLKHKDGEVARDCDGSLIPYRGGGRERFWKENNLPEGTTEFYCRNGKAYLSNTLPSD